MNCSVFGVRRLSEHYVENQFLKLIDERIIKFYNGFSQNLQQIQENEELRKKQSQDKRNG